MPKIRRKSIENDFLLIFFCMQSEGVAQSSILMILRHPLFPLAFNAVFWNWLLGKGGGRSQGRGKCHRFPLDEIMFPCYDNTNKCYIACRTNITFLVTQNERWWFYVLED